MKQNRLIELLIREVEATYECEGCSYAFRGDDRTGEELLDLIRFYKERINIETTNHPTEWNWAGFDYNKGYRDAEARYLKVIKNKDEEIKKLTNENKTNRKN